MTGRRATRCLAVIAVVLVAAACRDGTAPPTPTSAASDTPATLFSDAFDDDRNQWHAVAPTADVAIIEGGYSWIIPPGDQVAVAVPEALRERTDELERVHVAVQVRVNTGAGRVGIACRASGDPAAGELYVLSTRLSEVTAHRITRLAAGERVELAQTQPEPRDLPDIGTSHVLEADCVVAPGGVRLAFSVDGREVLRARDPQPLPPGVVGLWAASAPADVEPGDTDIVFDELVVERR